MSYHSYSVWMRFLQLVVFVYGLVDTWLLSRLLCYLQYFFAFYCFIYSIVCNVFEWAGVRESRMLLFSSVVYSDLWALYQQCFQYLLIMWFCSVEVVCLMLLCVVDFFASARFLFFYHVLVLLLRVSCGWILRSVGVFMRVFVSRVSFLPFVCPVRIFRVLLRLCCVFVVPFVFLCLILHFVSIDSRLWIA